MAPRPSSVNQDACKLGSLTHPSMGLFPQNIFVADGFLWLGMSVEDLYFIVQWPFVMNAAGAAELRSSSVTRPLRPTARLCNVDRGHPVMWSLCNVVTL